MNWVREKYAGLGSKERKQLWILIIAGCIGAYGFYASIVWQEMFHVQKMADRRADRIEKRIGEIKPPELEEGVSDETLADLKQKIAEQETLLKAFSAPLLPLGDSEAREELKLNITELVTLNQLRLSTLKSIGFDAEITNTELTGQALRDYFANRPSFKLVLSGQYYNFIKFVEGLEQQKYRVYVDAMTVTRADQDNSLLKIEVELKL